MIRRTLDQARERGARVYLLGDTFCAMQGKYDPRSNKSDVRPEHQVANYLDALVQTTADFLAPYSELVDVIGYGNHETSILNRQETDLVQRLVALLSDRYGSKAEAGSYAGWVRWIWGRGPNGRAQVNTHLMHYDHGSGGGGPVTKGVIGTNRRAVYVPDAQTVATGHIHERWMVEVARERVQPTTGKTFIDIQTHLQCGTGKEERLAGVGFHVERGRPPKPLGWWWIEFYYSAEHDKVLPRYIMTDR